MQAHPAFSWCWCMLGACSPAPAPAAVAVAVATSGMERRDERASVIAVRRMIHLVTPEVGGLGEAAGFGPSYPELLQGTGQPRLSRWNLRLMGQTEPYR